MEDLFSDFCHIACTDLVDSGNCDSSSCSPESRTHRALERFEQICKNKKARRGAVKQRAVDRQRLAIRASVERGSVHVSKRSHLQTLASTLTDAMLRGQRICVDLSWVDRLSVVEQSSLATQLGRVWSAQRKYAARSGRANDDASAVDGHSSSGASIFLCDWRRPDSSFAQQCAHRCCGFADYKWHLSTQPLDELFPPEEIVYLSPDSPNLLEAIESGKVYVIAGLVDKTVKSYATLSSARNLKYATAALPISKHLVRSCGAYGSGKKIVTVNQIFEILLTFLDTKDWTCALLSVLPKRLGFAAATLEQGDDDGVK